MAKYTLSPLAETDLEDIWDFIALDDPSAASRFVLKLSDRFSLLAAYPLMGTAREEIDPEIRLFTYERYSIYYTRTDFGVEISRILHGARDASAIFENELIN